MENVIKLETVKTDIWEKTEISSENLKNWLKLKNKSHMNGYLKSERLSLVCVVKKWTWKLQVDNKNR